MPHDHRGREHLDDRVRTEPDERQRPCGDAKDDREDGLSRVPRDGRVLEPERAALETAARLVGSGGGSRRHETRSCIAGAAGGWASIV